MILPYTTKPLHVANKVVLNMIKRGSMPAGQRRLCLLLLFVLGGAGCSEFNWLFVSENENGAKLQLLRNFRSFKRLDENPNMKRIGIARMMKIPSSTLNTILAKRTTLESACNDGNSSTRKQIRSGNFSELEETLPIPTRTAAALEAMDTVRRYVCSFNVDENVINQLSKIDTDLANCFTRSDASIGTSWFVSLPTLIYFARRYEVCASQHQNILIPHLPALHVKIADAL
ncbi:hypothetical protein T4E_3294 [Trichinella pseudospiralis]|uniref:HTH psq-type domain-containing protein n=1 Tax=Trichinella pseudospiralis TaxID=6337 RepID=A0A0V0Y4A1_TRIPS|nr:hypothetical protein T4E_6383 [Trichinella pseudospiralis]KRX95284.1 hypothetical protein T4E_3294 [Trichinella pseudospiralis]